MSRIFWKSILATPALLGASMLLTTEVKAESEQFLIAQEVTDKTELLNQLDNYTSEGGVNSNDQVTSVNQLRDVSPTDWSYEALRSLVERYGCLVGYPDRSYRGNRALSRYEFAAGLNACMQQMERLIASSESVLREDIDKLKRLMKEFEAELAALGARVDNLEGRVAFLEDHQFSTTTKLKGEAIIALTGSEILESDPGNNEPILANRVRLRLDSSFTGEDMLVTRLSAGNAGMFNSESVQRYRTANSPVTSSKTYGSSGTLNQTFNVYPGQNNDVQIDWLAYYVPIKLGEDTRLNTYISGWGGVHNDYAPTLNPYFEDYDGGNGALSTFASENPIYRIGGGGGIAFSYELNLLESLLGPTTATVGYLAGGAPNSPLEGNGIFNGDYSVLGQLNFNLNDDVALGFTYVHGFHKSTSPIFGSGARDGNGLVGTPMANLSSSSLNNYFSDQMGMPVTVEMKDKITNSYGAEFAWRLSDRINMSAFFNYTNVTRIGRGNDDVWTYGGGFAFPDLFKEGNVFGVFAGVQPYSGNSSYFINDGVNSYKTRVSSNNSLPIHVEGFYKYQLNDNISLTPGIIWINSPNQGNEDSQLIGTLRSTFTF